MWLWEKEGLIYPKSFLTFKGSCSKAPVPFRHIMAVPSEFAVRKTVGIVPHGKCLLAFVPVLAANMMGKAT